MVYIQFLRYRAMQTEIGNFRSFFALYPPKNTKNQNFEKWKNSLEISSFYTHTPKITIIWCMVPEIRSEEDKIFCHFGPFLPFYHPLPLMILNIKILKKMKKMPGDTILLYIHVYHKWTFYKHKWKSYEVWFLRYWAQQTESFVILNHFLPFNSPDNPKNQNFDKMKKTPGEITILHKCIINENHMMYGSWDMECDRQNFCHFGPLFKLFPP